LVFVEGGKPEKNPRRKTRTNHKLNPHMAPDRNRTQITLVGGKRSAQVRHPFSPFFDIQLKTLLSVETILKLQFHTYQFLVRSVRFSLFFGPFR